MDLIVGLSGRRQTGWLISSRGWCSLEVSRTLGISSSYYHHHWHSRTEGALSKTLCRWHQDVCCDWHAWRTGCHPEGIGQAKNVGPWEFYEDQQDPARPRAKCWTRWDNPLYQYRLGDERIESFPVEKDLRILVGEKLDMSPQHATTLTASWAASNAESSTDCWTVPPICSSENPPGVLLPALGSSPQELLFRPGPEMGHKNYQMGKALLPGRTVRAESCSVFKRREGFGKTLLQPFST